MEKNIHAKLHYGQSYTYLDYVFRKSDEEPTPITEGEMEYLRKHAIDIITDENKESRPRCKFRFFDEDGEQIKMRKRHRNRDDDEDDDEDEAEEKTTARRRGSRDTSSRKGHTRKRGE